MIEETIIEEGLIDVDGTENILDNDIKDEIIAANDLNSGNADTDDELFDQVDDEEDPEDADMADDDDDIDHVEAEDDIIDEDEPETDQTDLVIDVEEEDY